MSGFVSLAPAVPTILSTNTATTFTAGVPGGSGAADDTILLAIKILLNATAVTAALKGFRSDVSGDDLTDYILTGMTTQDVYVPLNWRNTGGPLIITASVALKVIVETIPSPFYL